MKLEPAKSRIAKIIFLSLGTVFFIVGIAGLLLPVLPGWLFLLPALFCFAKSSSVLNRWLRNRKSMQKYFIDKNEINKNTDSEK